MVDRVLSVLGLYLSCLSIVFMRACFDCCMCFVCVVCVFQILCVRFVFVAFVVQLLCVPGAGSLLAPGVVL